MARKGLTGNKCSVPISAETLNGSASTPGKWTRRVRRDASHAPCCALVHRSCTDGYASLAKEAYRQTVLPPCFMLGWRPTALASRCVASNAVLHKYSPLE